MVRYGINEVQLQKILGRLGYANIAQFARAHQINRATLSNYLQGRGPLPESFYAIAEALQIDPLQLLTPISSAKAIPNINEIIPLIVACSKTSPQIAIGLLGSRVAGGAQKYSDWDLGITGGIHHLTTKEFLRIKQVVDDMGEDLPRTIDVMNLDAAPEWFLKGIHYTPQFLVGNESSWAYFMGVLHGIQKAA